MHQHKAVVQVIYILCFVNFVLAAPAVREIRDDVMVRVPAEDMGTVVEKRFKFFNTPMIPWEDSSWDSGDEGYETASDEPPDHSPTSTSTPTPSDQPSTPRKQKRPKIMTPEKIKTVKIVASVGLLTAAILSLVDIQVSSTNDTAS